MPKPSLSAVVGYCDRLLQTTRFQDYERASNGLQVENSGRVSRIAAAVDASLATVRLAIAAEADLLLVHHGLFWGPAHPWTGKRYELLRCLLKHNLAVYSSHLPLDAHRQYGNNAQLCAALGLGPIHPFFLSHGQPIGWQTRARLSRSELGRRLQQACGVKPRLVPAGPTECRRLGVVSGGAGAELKQAAEAGLDTFITGEGPHWTYALAEELGINVFYGGHYATETLGVRALGAHLARRFKVPWIFVEHPTGL